MNYRFLVVFLLPAAAAAASRCPDVKKTPFGEVTPCAACTLNNFEDGAPLCGYCYATGNCVEVTAKNLLTGVCSRANSTAARYDYSLNTDGACDCRPDKWTNCSACASLSHMSCTWVSDGSRKDMWKIPVPFTKSTVTHESTTNLNGTCQSILSAETKHYELTNSKGDLVISLDTTNTVNDFFWGQCSISGAKFAALLVGVGVLSLAACATAGVCYCACAAKKKRRQEQQQRQGIYYAAPGDQLLGAPVVVSYA
jgi:hypothetical protein